jgi:hypothetical protein
MPETNYGKMPAAAIRKGPIFPSDTLRDFLELLDDFPSLRPLVGKVIQFLVVLDASSVQGELRWRVRSRRDSSARTSLHELIEAGVIVAVAPLWMKMEIEEDLPVIAAETGVPVTTIRQEWTQFETLIRYFRPRPDIAPKVPCPDPKDLPYIQTRDQIAADFIWTRDSHFLGTNPPDLAGGLDKSLRDYARATSILVGAKAGSGFAVLCGIEILTAVVRAGIEEIRRIPPVLKVCITLAIIGLLLHSKSRERLLGWLKQGLALLERVKPVVVSISRDAVKELADAARTAKSTELVIREAIPTVVKPRVSAVVMVRVVCLKAGEPLPLSEIEKRVRGAGYLTRSRNFGAYLRKILRQNSEFVEVATGLWTLRAA